MAHETSRYEKPTALGLDVREPSYVAFARHWPTAGGVNGMLAAPWPPVYPKQPDEPPRVAPSRAKKSL